MLMMFLICADFFPDFTHSKYNFFFARKKELRLWEVNELVCSQCSNRLLARVGAKNMTSDCGSDMHSQCKSTIP